MDLILTVVHVLVALGLILVVLLQRGSGADMGAAFGGTSQSVFGSRGTSDFLGKLTAGLATVFMLTSLTLAFFSNRPSTSSVMDGATTPVTEQQPAPAKPVEPPTGANLPAAPEGDALPVVPKSANP